MDPSIYIMIARLFDPRNDEYITSVLCDAFYVADREERGRRFKENRTYLSEMNQHAVQNYKVHFSKGVIKRLPEVLADRVVSCFQGHKPHYDNTYEAYLAIENSGVRIHDI